MAVAGHKCGGSFHLQGFPAPPTYGRAEVLVYFRNKHELCMREVCRRCERDNQFLFETEDTRKSGRKYHDPRPMSIL